ncbi:hypothetical protein E1J38_007280 [Seonamhaeicola sediminis]|uniref:DinB family protein n=1 Tax=Seonamhaeicola sediminis TaxID=2528206 RepID=A0A562YDD7_9FLAO|nr:hypothetical protein [Seonamhaeicola sediminis]TWO32661.1 hypothetical protein E1J38_007280 [Seonamhaeicola sediminis]
MNKLILIFVLSFCTLGFAQDNSDKLPFYEIEDYPENYTSNLLVARMIDGLGFRYYWATEGLRDIDFEYKASESGRTTGETIDHIYGLSRFIRNSILENDKDNTNTELGYTEKRKQTLINLKVVSNAFKNSKETFKFEDTSVPFWNIINGPISDALWHCGQVVMLRRASDNPINSNISLFKGSLRD